MGIVLQDVGFWDDTVLGLEGKVSVDQGVGYNFKGLGFQG